MFAAMNQIAPPIDMITRIMNAVSKLPRHEKPIETSWGTLNQLMVLDDPIQLC
jgi:hypothetical protein